MRRSQSCLIVIGSGGWFRIRIREWVPVLDGRLWSCVPGVINGVRGQLISATKTKVGVDGFDVETEYLSVLAGNDKGKSDVGTKRVPENIG